MAYGSGATLTHRALFYCGTAEFVESTAAVVERAWAGDHAVLVALPAAHLELLQARLTGRPDDLQWVDMTTEGRNPGRILPGVLTAFADAHDEQPVTMVGEPIWPGRRPDEYAAAVAHEALINLAFDGADVTVVCPYDAEHLAADALADARSTHPEIGDGEGFAASPQYADPESVAAQAMQSMPPPPAQARAMSVHGAGDLSGARQLVMSEGERAGLTPRRRDRFTLAAHEATANAVRHGGGSGELTIWRDGDDLVCQVHSALPLADAMAGRRAPQPEATRGRGLVLVNEICDLVQVSPGPDGTTVRMRTAIR